MKGIYKVLSKRLFASRRMLLISAIIMAIGAKYTFSYSRVQYLQNMLPEEYNLLPYLIYQKITYWTIVSYLLLPLFLFLLEITSVVFDRYKILLKYKSIKQWWKDKIVGTGMFSLIYIIVINTTILGAVLLSGHGNKITPDFLMYMLLGVVYQVMGFLILGTFYHIVVLKTSQKYVGFFTTFITIVVLQAIERGLGLNSTITLESYMFLVNKAQFKLALGDLIPLPFLIIIFLILYSVGSWTSYVKDIYWRD